MPTVRAGDLPYQAYNTEVPSPQVPSAYQTERATPEDFGVGVGQAISQLGSQIGRTADVFAEGAIARQQLENQVRADDATNKYQESINKILHGDPDVPGDTGFYGKRGEDAMRAYSTTYKSIGDLRNTMRGQLANDRQRLSFDAETRREQSRALAAMGSHYDREFKNYGTAVNTAGVRNSMGEAATGLEQGDQAAFESGLGNAMKYKLKQLELQGLGNNDQAVNDALATVREDGVKMKFQKLAEENPYKAKQFLDANSDALKPGEAHQLRQSIDAQWRKVQAQIDAGEMPAPEGWNEPPKGKRVSGKSVSGGYSFGMMKTLAVNAGFQGADADYMAALAMVESSGNPRAHNPDGEDSYGLTQINARAHGDVAKEAYDNPQRAFELAKMVYDKQGWDAWRNSRAGAESFLRELGGTIKAEPVDGGPAPKRQAAGPVKIDYAFGDSNAQLATNHGVPGVVGTDVVAGDSPKASWERMQARGADFFKGKTILLSPGSSNDPSQVDFIEKQAAFAQQAGVKGMVIPGVGPGIPGGAKAADVLNAQLAGIAEKYGAKFVMPDNWQKDGYHIAQVPKFLEKAQAAFSTGTSTEASKSTPQVTGRGKPAPGPSGSSTAEADRLADFEQGGGGDAPDTIEGQQPVIKGLTLAPIPPPDPGMLPDAQVPGLTDKIADIASQPWAKENPTRLRDAIQAARQGANARWTDSQRQRQQANQEAQAISQKAENEYMPRFAPGADNPPTDAEILKDGRLTPEARMKLVGFSHRQEKHDPDPRLDHANTNELFKGIIAPYGTPGKISSTEPIDQAYAAGSISYQNMQRLHLQLAQQKVAGNETKNQVLNDWFHATEGTVKGLHMGVSGKFEGITDPNADTRWFYYKMAVQSKIKEYEDSGKNPMDLFMLTDPKDPHSSIVGKMLDMPQFKAPITTGSDKPDLTTEEGILRAHKAGQVNKEQALDALTKLPGIVRRPTPPVAPAYNGP